MFLLTDAYYNAVQTHISRQIKALVPKKWTLYAVHPKHLGDGQKQRNLDVLVVSAGYAKIDWFATTDSL